jgi:hypothetical protein
MTSTTRAGGNDVGGRRPLADACAVGQSCPRGSACNNPSGSCALAESCRYTVVIPGRNHGGLTKIPLQTLDQVEEVLAGDPEGRAWACDAEYPKRRLQKADLR